MENAVGETGGVSLTKVIVAFPNRDNAANIRNILVRGGYSVIGVCTTGAQALQYTELLDEGILVCGYKLPDMLYTRLREYLPPEFEMLLVASPDKWQGEIMEGVVGLPMPLKVYDLMNTMEMIRQAMDRRRRKRKKERRIKNPEQQKIIREAKELLIARNHMSEEEAHRYLQKCSMDSGTKLVETAEMVLSIMAE